MELLKHAYRVIENATKTGEASENLCTLADTLRSKAISLGSSRATELSIYIPLLSLTAAKLAVLSIDPNTEKFKTFESDILYYKDSETTGKLVNKYLSFKESFAPNKSVNNRKLCLLDATSVAPIT